MYARLFGILLSLTLFGCDESLQLKLTFPKNDKPEIIWNLPAFVSLVDAQNLFSQATDVRMQSTQMDEEGNFYVYGDFNGELAGVASLDRDLFILKLNSSGNLIWRVHLTSGVFGILDASGLERAEGDIKWDQRTRSLYFSATTTSSYIENNPNASTDIIIGRITNAGVLRWIRHYGLETEASFNNPSLNWREADLPGSLNFTSEGNLLVTFQTSGSLFDTNAGATDVGVMKVNAANGNIMQGMQLGVSTLQNFNASADGSGTEGLTQGKASLDGANLVIPIRTNGPLIDEYQGTGSDAAYMVVDRNLNLIELKQIGQNTYSEWVSKGNFAGGNVNLDDQVRSVLVLGPGHYLFYGKTSGNLSELKNGPASGTDLFFAIFRNGELTDIKQYGQTTWPVATNTEEPRYITRDELGNIYCTGHTRSSLFEDSGANLKPFVIKIDSEANLLGGVQLGLESAAQYGLISNRYNLIAPGSFVIHRGRVMIGGYNSVSGSSSGPSNPYLWSFDL